MNASTVRADGTPSTIANAVCETLLAGLAARRRKKRAQDGKHVLVRRAMKTSVIDVSDMLSVLSVDGVEAHIGEVAGVESVTVNFAAASATVRYDETRLKAGDIKVAVRQAAYTGADATTTTPASSATEGMAPLDSPDASPVALPAAPATASIDGPTVPAALEVESHEGHTMPRAKPDASANSDGDAAPATRPAASGEDPGYSPSLRGAGCSALWLSRPLVFVPQAAQFQQMVNHESGLLGVSETSGDVRDLLSCEADDVRAAEAIALFCYQIRKCVGAFAAALSGMDTFIFAGGIGENAPVIRARICDKLGFLGIQLDDDRNANNEAVVSSDASRVSCGSCRQTRTS